MLDNPMWYVPAGLTETFWFALCFWVSLRLAKSLKICDKDLGDYRYTESDVTEWKGWVKID